MPKYSEATASATRKLCGCCSNNVHRAFELSGRRRQDAGFVHHQFVALIRNSPKAGWGIRSEAHAMQEGFRPEVAGLENGDKRVHARLISQIADLPAPDLSIGQTSFTENAAICALQNYIDSGPALILTAHGYEAPFVVNRLDGVGI